jgi:site-specific DNA recombinase
MPRPGSQHDSGARRTGVIYARVSSKDQAEEGYSIPAQLELLRRYAATKGITVLKEFTDVETAKQKGRKGFGEMLMFLRKTTTCRNLLVEKTDRLHRNQQDYATIDGLIQDGLAVHFVKENEVISKDSTSQAKFVYGIKALMAKNFSDNLGEETKKGMRQKAVEGMWPSFAPVGYLNVPGTNGKNVIVPDPAIAPQIARLFEQYATGKYSLKEITVMAHADGMRFRKSGKPLPKSAIHKMFRTRVYSGNFDFDGKMYEGQYEHIVTQELWDQVQDVLDGRGVRKTRKVKEQFAYSGLITCGHCGCAVVGDIKKGKYVYYRCSGAKGKCPESYTRGEELESKFAAVLKGLSFNQETLACMRRALLESHQDEKQLHAAAVERLQREHRRLQDRLERMYEDKLDGQIENEFYNRKAADYRREQARIMREIQAHGTANQSYIEDGVRLLELAQQAHVQFEKQPPAQKRRLLGFVLSNCSWKEGSLTVEYRHPFELLAVAVASEQQQGGRGSAEMARNDIWLPGMDSNHDSRLQRPLSYH